MAMAVIGFVDLFSDLGTVAAVIQRTELSDRLLSSILWFNVAIGVGVAIALWYVAPMAAKIFGEDRLNPLMRFLAVTFVIAGFRSLPQALLQKSLAFSTLAKLEIANAAVSSSTVVWSALSGQGVWSLAYQTLATVLFMTISMWIVQPWRPRVSFNWKELKDVFSYSLNLTVFNVFNYFARNADNLLIGKFLGAQDLGYYDLAYRLMMYPLQAIWSVLGRVMFPVYAKLKEDHARFGSAYLKVASSIGLLAFPAMIGLMLVAQPFVLTVYGAKWEPMVPVLAILAGIGALQSVGTTTGVIYQVTGRTDWLMRWGIVAGTIIVVAIAIGLRWGIVGVAWAYAAINLILVYPAYAIPFRLIGLRFPQLLSALWPPFASSIAMAGAVLGVKALIEPVVSASASLFILLITGVTAYVFATWTLNRAHLRDLLSTFGMRIG
jgi:PST family polysaccharide transporter